MNRYNDQVTAIIHPYLEKAATSEHGGPPLDFMHDMVSLHAELLGFATKANKELEDLLDLLRKKYDTDTEIRTTVLRLSA